MTKTEIDRRIYRKQNIRLILEPGHVAQSREVFVKKDDAEKGAQVNDHSKYTTKERNTWKK